MWGLGIETVDTFRKVIVRGKVLLQCAGRGNRHDAPHVLRS